MHPTPNQSSNKEPHIVVRPFERLHRPRSWLSACVVCIPYRIVDEIVSEAMAFSIRLVVDVVTSCNIFRIESFTVMSFLLSHLMSVLLFFS